MNLKQLFPVALLASLAVLVFAGCGNSDDSGTTSAATTTTTTTTTPAPAKSVDMVMTEFKFAPDDVTAAAGKVTFNQRNDGKVVHEFVLIKTDKPANSFPVKDGRMNEETAGTNVGEIGDVAPGKTKSKTFDLKPGKYVFVCNLAGHYPGGMYGSLTVQ